MKVSKTLVGCIAALAVFVGVSIANGASWTTVAPIHVIFGTDGTDPQPIRTDTQGRQVVVSSTGTNVFVAGVPGTLTDRSSTITAGGVAQSAASSNTSRMYLMCQNIDTVNTEDLWLNPGGTAAANTAGSFRLPSGASVVFEGTFIPTSAISVIAATTGHKYTCKEG